MPEQSDPAAWLRHAQHDLAAARVVLDDPELPARLSCFHAQLADLPEIAAAEAATVVAVATTVIDLVVAAQGPEVAG